MLGLEILIAKLRGEGNHKDAEDVEEFNSPSPKKKKEKEDTVDPSVKTIMYRV